MGKSGLWPILSRSSSAQCDRYYIHTKSLYKIKINASLLDTESIFSAAHVRLADSNEVGSIRKSFEPPRSLFTTHSTDEPSINFTNTCNHIHTASQKMSQIYTSTADQLQPSLVFL